MFVNRGPVQQQAIIHGSGLADLEGTSSDTLGGHQIPVLAWANDAMDILISPQAYGQSPGVECRPAHGPQLSAIALTVPGRYKFETHGKAALHSFTLEMPLDVVITAGALSSVGFAPPRPVQGGSAGGCGAPGLLAELCSRSSEILAEEH